MGERQRVAASIKRMRILRLPWSFLPAQAGQTLRLRGADLRLLTRRFLPPSRLLIVELLVLLNEAATVELRETIRSNIQHIKV